MIRILDGWYSIEKTKQLEISDTPCSTYLNDICRLKNLEHLTLVNSNLTNIPKEIGNLLNLKCLNLRHNQLTSIPKEIGKLLSLEKLFLENNKLTTIPKELSNLKNLYFLGLIFNNLRIIPVELLEIKQILYIDETSYKINNLDDDAEILIFSNLETEITNLPICLKEIWLYEAIINYNIKLPFYCNIIYYDNFT